MNDITADENDRENQKQQQQQNEHTLVTSENVDSNENDANDRLNKNSSPTLSDKFQSQHASQLTSSFSNFSICSDESWNTILANLKFETKQLLTNVPHQVKLRLDVEIENSKKVSPIADIVGLPTYGLERLDRMQLLDMNVGQLQVILNDMCNQIEDTNEELKLLLVDRDDYYMQQDSLLVDIEDIIK